mmetsp:Transcript_2220/g.5265  ORF Transcript_2220/g.5265 Transcript_2220/m.5265 type:complete len:110 (+) Transcript_2220:198-527(+)|eukprot:CAMPEP_0178994654 /NCGR_PEP_ID=MMETSP0795-20121207/7389_1 /TAXON_ID=88552 /ORGANISM="Amoebophrya sp., Strain Ameob2" /LENGTH=109 /DNA_ID=CAMNT_0020686869 /DNA_START=177 /DNA_END=506 /DNA_ORIENTATION=-
MASLESIHVRVKRKNQTFFLLVESPDMPVVGLKEKLVLLFADKGIKSPLDLRLLYEDLILDDDVSLRSQRVVDSSILHLCLRVDETNFETPEYDDLDALHVKFSASAAK